MFQSGVEWIRSVARKVKASPSSVLYRIRRMKNIEVIKDKGYTWLVHKANLCRRTIKLQVDKLRSRSSNNQQSAEGKHTPKKQKQRKRSNKEKIISKFWGTADKLLKSNKVK